MFFFFQAEDGIRDLTVTGVQTCALPIYTTWQSRVRRGLTPVIIGLVTAGGYAMALAVDAGWIGVGVTVGAAGLLLTNRINPLWLLGAGAVLGGVRPV